MEHLKEVIPIEKWGKDHWSTFAYLETRVVDGSGKIDNRRMRCNARLHRKLVGIGFGDSIQDGSAYPTRLIDGEIANHDDWSCAEDMVGAGLIEMSEQVAYLNRSFGCNKVTVKLTPLGYEVAAQLRRHKAEGGSYHGFRPAMEPPK